MKSVYMDWSQLITELTSETAVQNIHTKIKEQETFNDSEDKIPLNV